MARFPKKEAEIVALAEQLLRGPLDNNPIYPQPPVHPILIRIKSMIYSARRDNFIAKQAAAEQAIAAKNESLLRTPLRYLCQTVLVEYRKNQA